MRVLWMRANGAISDADWTELCQLESHFDRFMQQVDGKEFAVNVSWTLDQVNASSNFDRALVERLYATVCLPGYLDHELEAKSYLQLSVNSFTLVTPEYDPLGACLDLKVALANHSCEANAYIVMDGPQVSLRSLTTIPKDAEVFISYIDSSFSLRHRKGQLAQKYFFDCSCSKCTKGPTLREDVYLRDVNDAPRRILEAIDTEMVREWCAGSEERAKIAATHKTEAELRDFRLTVLNHRLQQNQELARREGEKRHLEDGLRLCQESRMFRFDRQPFASMVHDYMVALIGEGQLHRAFRLAVVKYFHIVPYHYPTPHHPLRVVHAWTLAQLALYVATERESEQTLAWERRGLDYGVVVFGLLKEAELNVGKSHGTSSRFAKMVQAKVEEVTTDMTRGDRAAFAAIPGKLMGQMQTLKLIGEDLKLV